ncbi:Dna Excision Repair Protein Ercc-6-Like 2 [Manis pentadactyla]|nr:Dna Excision Repair Protein Ercc-6-Like 2 [Manis pentadactyla]
MKGKTVVARDFSKRKNVNSVVVRQTTYFAHTGAQPTNRLEEPESTLWRTTEKKVQALLQVTATDTWFTVDL